MAGSTTNTRGPTRTLIRTVASAFAVWMVAMTQAPRARARSAARAVRWLMGLAFDLMVGAPNRAARGAARDIGIGALATVAVAQGALARTRAAGAAVRRAMRPVVAVAGAGIIAGAVAIAAPAPAVAAPGDTVGGQVTADVPGLSDEQLAQQLRAEVNDRKVGVPGPYTLPPPATPWGPPAMVPGGNPFPQQQQPSPREMAIRDEMAARSVPVPRDLKDPRDNWSGAEGEVPVPKLGNLYGFSMRYAYNEFTGQVQIGIGAYVGHQGIPGRAGDLAVKPDGLHFAGRVELGYRVPGSPSAGKGYDPRGTGWFEFFGEGTYNPFTGEARLLGQFSAKSPSGQSGAINGALTRDPKTGEWSFTPDGWSQQMVGRGGGGVREDFAGDKQQMMLPPNKGDNPPAGKKFNLGRVPFSLEAQGRVQGTGTVTSPGLVRAIKRAEELAKQVGEGARGAWKAYEDAYNQVVDQLTKSLGINKAREMLGLPPLPPKSQQDPQSQQGPGADRESLGGHYSPGTGDGDAQDRDRERGGAQGSSSGGGAARRPLNNRRVFCAGLYRDERISVCRV